VIVRIVARTLLAAVLLQISCTAGISSPSERATFDVVAKRVRSEYYGYESRRTEIDTRLERYRAMVSDNTSEFDLYFRILTPMLDEFGESHNFAEPPAGANKDAVPQQREDASIAAIPAEEIVAGLGLSVGWVSHRGEADYVFDVRRGSGADIAGVEPGSHVKRLQVSSTATGGRAELDAVLSNGVPHSYRFDFPPMNVEAARSAYDLPSGYRVIRFDTFNRENVEWFRQQLGESKRGAIIDLRRNSGGRVVSTNQMLSSLLPARSIIGEAIEDGRRTLERTDRWGSTFHLPLAVLIGPETRSSAEVFAAALQYHRRAILLGKTTAGEVMTSRTFGLPDGGALTLAVSDFVGPDGQRIERLGVRPDTDLLLTLADIRSGRDVILEAAVAALSQPSPQERSNPSG